MRSRRGTLVLAVALVLALAALPGVAAAEQRASGTVIVAEGEQVDSLTATGGTVIVRGTVTGDVDAYAGSVVVTESGAVEGDLQAYAGSLRVEGTVGGNVVAYAGSVVLTDSGQIRGSLGAAAGEVTVAGTVRGDVTAGAALVTLAPSANVRNDVNYDGRLERAPGATVGGQVRAADDLGLGPAPPALPPGTFFIYGVLSNLLVGGILLYAGEDFSVSAAENAVLDPGPSLFYGLAAAVVVPVGLLALAITVVGLPVAAAALLALPALGWVAAVLGRFALGAWLVSFADVDRPAAGLAVGVVLVALLARIPFRVGVGVRAGVLLLGVGAGVVELRARLGESGRY
ncbi:MAG: polymer-forming cytoskeletal protein [Haloferacaceae archaeon]